MQALLCGKDNKSKTNCVIKGNTRLLFSLLILSTAVQNSKISVFLFKLV